MHITRRSLIKSLLASPFISWFSPTKPNVGANRDLERLSLAFNMLRFVDTAEHWHRDAFGDYVRPTTLAQSPVIDRLAHSERAEKMGVGQSLLSSVSLTNPEVIPGWELRLRIRRGEKSGDESFVAIIRSRESQHALVNFGRGRVEDAAILGGGDKALIKTAFGEFAEGLTPIRITNHQSLAQRLFRLLSDFELGGVAYAQEICSGNCVFACYLPDGTKECCCDETALCEFGPTCCNVYNPNAQCITGCGFCNYCCCYPC